MRKGILGFIFFITCLTSSAYAGEKKTLNLPVDTSFQKVNSTLNSPLDTCSFIRSMTQPQLYTLINYLFEMDSIPLDLISEINAAILAHQREQQFANEMHTDWDEKNIFPLNELNTKTDTTCIINLIDELHTHFSLPFKGVITSTFGWRKAYNSNHNGVDIDLERGDKVVAAFDGIVRFAKWQGGFGNVVVVRHSNGLETLYAHLSKLKVKVGQVINSGNILGLGGSTGHSTGSHLHFEVRFKSKPINPKYLIEFEREKLVCETVVLKTTRSGLAAFPPDTKEYFAQKGDTIFEVAKRFGVSAKTLSQRNGLNQWLRLKAGQKIVIG